MSIFFDQTYYLQNNPDVLAAVARGETTAEQHFNTFGWKEGRNPNDTFDVNFYLTKNADVLAAGVNPLTHFTQFGAAEGRSPSASFVTAANFDTKTYAAKNPDLAAAGVVTASQLYAHFATFGFDENRPGVQTITGAPIVDGVPGGGVGSSFSLTTVVGESLVGTGNNDTFSATANATGLAGTPAATLNPTDKVDGAGGIDTFNIVATSASAVIPVGVAKGVEILNLISNVTGDNFGSAVDAASFSGVQQLWQIAAGTAADVNNVTNGVTVGFNAGDVSNLQMATGATTAGIALVSANSGQTIIVDETTAGTLATVNVNGSVAGAGSLAINLDNTNGSGSAASAEATVNLGLTTSGTISITSATAKTIDASASTGDLTISASAAAAVETLKGGSGNDTLTGVAATKLIEGGAGKDTITSGGAAGQVINGGANGTGTGFQADLITLGAGAQTVLTQVGQSGLTADTIDQISTFTTTVDKLDFNLAAGSATNFQNGGLSSSAAVGLAAANTALNGTVQYFATEVSGNTLVFVDSDLNGDADMAVQLTGVTGLTGVVAGDIIA
jgi:hypothetical protein